MLGVREKEVLDSVSAWVLQVCVCVCVCVYVLCVLCVLCVICIFLLLSSLFPFLARPLALTLFHALPHSCTHTHTHTHTHKDNCAMREYR